jgi:hypothetical protein
MVGVNAAEPDVRADLSLSGAIRVVRSRYVKRKNTRE